MNEDDTEPAGREGIAGPSRTLLFLFLAAAAVRLVLALGVTAYFPSLTESRWALLMLGKDGLSLPLLAPGMPDILRGFSPFATLLLAPIHVIWSITDPVYADLTARSLGFLLRFPGIVADLLVGFLLFRLVGPRDPGLLKKLALWLLNPAVILIFLSGSLLSFLPAFLLLALVLERQDRPELAMIASGLAATVHPFGFLFVPLLFVRILRQGRRVAGSSIALGLTAVLIPAFTHPGGILASLRVVRSHFSANPVASAGALNVWHLILGNHTPDTRPHVFPSPLFFAGVIVAGTLCYLAYKIWEGEKHALEDSLAGLAFLAPMLITRVTAECFILPLGMLLLLTGVEGLHLIFSLGILANLVYAFGLSMAWGTTVAAGLGHLIALFNLVFLIRVLTTIAAPTVAFHVEELPDPPESHPGRRRPIFFLLQEIFVVVLITAAFAHLRYHNLGYPNDKIFDEIYHARAGQEIYQGKAPNEWVHPPLAKLLIGQGILHFGMNGFGWRFAPWLFGSLMVPVLYLLARGILKDPRFALLGTLLFCLDGNYFVMSRVAMTNAFALFFQSAALMSFWFYLQESHRMKARIVAGPWLLSTSLFVGLGVSTRWTCLWLLGLVGLGFALNGLFLVWRERGVERKGALLCGGVSSGLVHFVIFPVTLYILSYLPLVKLGCYSDLKYVANLQPQIWKFHTTFTTHHPYYSQWYTWAFTHRPVWYYYKKSEKSPGCVEGIIALGNPLLWWTSIPAVLFGLWFALKDRHLGALYLVGAYGALYLPWALSPRTLNYSHYYLEPLPYACLLMAYLLKRLHRRVLLGGEILLIVSIFALVFAFFYPLLSGLPLPNSAYDLRIWSPLWI